MRLLADASLGLELELRPEGTLLEYDEVACLDTVLLVVLADSELELESLPVAAVIVKV